MAAGISAYSQKPSASFRMHKPTQPKARSHQPAGRMPKAAVAVAVAVLVRDRALLRRIHLIPLPRLKQVRFHIAREECAGLRIHHV